MLTDNVAGTLRVPFFLIETGCTTKNGTRSVPVTIEDSSMHIRDGLLSPEVCLAAGALSAAAVAYSWRRLQRDLASRTVPLTGMMAAVVFAGQMVNFPLFGLPVSGHLIGGVLAGVILGPWAGCVALTLVLVVQAVLFADGGLLSLGANVLNMAVVGTWSGSAVYEAIRRAAGASPRATVFSAVVAAYFSVLAAAAMFCGEFALSHGSAPFDLSQLVLWMLTYHALIGVGEAGITGAVLGFVFARRPDLLKLPNAPQASPLRGLVTAGALAACLVALLLAPWASSWPDGLEAVGERLGFNDLGTDRALILPSYDVPMPAGWQALSVGLAGLLGTVVVFGLGWGLGRVAEPAKLQHPDSK
jgi:cobalt/nickel transport system permease protein